MTTLFVFVQGERVVDNTRYARGNALDMNFLFWSILEEKIIVTIAMLMWSLHDYDECCRLICRA